MWFPVIGWSCISTDGLFGFGFRQLAQQLVAGLVGYQWLVLWPVIELIIAKRYEYFHLQSRRCKWHC